MWNLAGNKDFAFSNPLPKTFEYINKTTKFEFGSGANNEDELMDVREEALRVQQEMIEAILNRKKNLEIERKKREEEERLKKLREESDRRLAEGIEKRRLLRIHFAQVKAERLKAEEDKVLKIKEEQEAILLQIEKEKELQRLMKIEKDKLKVLEAERALMFNEEIYQLDLDNRIREIKYMQHEDIKSYLMRRAEEIEIEQKAEKMKSLEKLYQTHQPFKFKHERTPSLYSSSISHLENSVDMASVITGGNYVNDIRSIDRKSEYISHKKGKTDDEEEDFLMLSESKYDSNSFLIDKSEIFSNKLIFSSSITDNFAVNSSSNNHISPSKPMNMNRGVRGIAVKQPVIWAGLSNAEEEEEKIKRREDEQKMYLNRIGSQIDRQIVLSDPIRLGSAKISSSTLGFSKKISKSMSSNHLDPLPTSTLMLSSLVSQKTLESSNHRNDLELQRILHSISTVNPSKLLHDVSSDFFNSTDMETQAILSQKNENTLASYTAMLPHKIRPKSADSTVNLLRNNRDKVREFFNSDALLQPKYFKNSYYDSCFPTVRHRPALQENFSHDKFHGSLDSFSSDNPLLKEELDQQGSISPKLHNYNHNNYSNYDSRLAASNIDGDDDDDDGDGVALLSPDIDPDRISPENELYLEKTLKKFKKRPKISKTKKSKKVEEEVELNHYTDPDVLPPPFYHKSMALFGQKTEIKDFDPRLTKHKDGISTNNFTLNQGLSVSVSTYDVFNGSSDKISELGASSSLYVEKKDKETFNYNTKEMNNQTIKNSSYKTKSYEVKNKLYNKTHIIDITADEIKNLDNNRVSRIQIHLDNKSKNLSPQRVSNRPRKESFIDLEEEIPVNKPSDFQENFLPYISPMKVSERVKSVKYKDVKYK